MSTEEKYLDIILSLKEKHEKKLEAMEQIVNLDDGQNILIRGTKDGESFELPEKHRVGFVSGIVLAMGILGEFPVKVERS